MSLANLALDRTDDFPLKRDGNVHSGKVRSCYWQSPLESKRLTEQRGYSIFPGSRIGILITSDKISAYDCNWQAEQGLGGVPGKGASLNSISHHWFQRYEQAGLAGHHVLEAPHPLVWIVQRTEPVKVEAILRQYITGSMWRAYHEDGKREFCGVELLDGLEKNQRLTELMFTPTTKGVLEGIPGVLEKEDAKITKQQILDYSLSFGFRSQADVHLMEKLVRDGWGISDLELAEKGIILVDDKKELGYAPTQDGRGIVLLYIDEVVTPDSSRFWMRESYERGKPIEESKEGFREYLQFESGLERDVLLNDDRFDERNEIARNFKVPVDQFMKVSQTYTGMAERITGQEIPKIESARDEILQVLSELGMVE